MHLKKLMNVWNTSFRYLRNVSSSSISKAAYECDGKTTVTVLNKESGFGVMIDKYSKQGFRLNNGMFIIGPMVLFPHTAFSWNVGGDHDINRRSLQLFSLIEPRLDLIVVGYGKKTTNVRKLNEEILALKSQNKINVEILPVEKAAATFNYLTSERRWVAGAFIPPETVHLLESEIAAQTAKRKSIYEIDEYMI